MAIQQFSLFEGFRLGVTRRNFTNRRSHLFTALLISEPLQTFGIRKAEVTHLQNAAYLSRNMLKMQAYFTLAFALKLTVIVHGSNVVDLNAQNFDKHVDGERFVFVFFYAAWQDQSQKFLEWYEEVGNAFSQRDDVIIAKVNGYEEMKLATKYWVDRYPAFRYFIKGSVTEET